MHQPFSYSSSSFVLVSSEMSETPAARFLHSSSTIFGIATHNRGRRTTTRTRTIGKRRPCCVVVILNVTPSPLLARRYRNKRFQRGYQRGILPLGSTGWTVVFRKPFSQCLTIATNLGNDMSSNGLTRYSSSRERVVLVCPPLPRVYDFFQRIRSPDEIGGAFRAGPVSGLENNPVSKVQQCHLGLFLAAQGREERRASIVRP